MAEIEPGRHLIVVGQRRVGTFQSRTESLRHSTNPVLVLRREVINFGLNIWQIPEARAFTVDQRQRGNPIFFPSEITLGVVLDSFGDLANSVEAIQGIYTDTVQRLGRSASLPEINLKINTQSLATLRQRWLMGLKADPTVMEAYFIEFARTEEERKQLRGEIQRPPYNLLDTGHQD